MFFDTSSLPPGITSATLVLRIVDKKVDAGHDFSLVIQNGQPSHPAKVDADYDKDLYSGDYGSINTTSFNTNDWISISFDASLINTSGTTKLMVRSSKDIAGTIVAGPTPKSEFISYNTGGGADPYLIVYYTPVGWNTFQNVSAWLTMAQGWNTFSNITSWTNVSTGWNTFGHTAVWQGPEGWNTFNNHSTYIIIDQGWNTFGNISTWTDVGQGWNNFSNTASWKTKASGWNTFGNIISWVSIDQGWNCFRNVSTWVLIDSGWNTFHNLSYMAVLDIFPANGSLVCPTCYENDTFYYFNVHVDHTNGTLMDITWTTWNGTVIGAVSNVGNGTYHIVPIESVYPMNYSSVFNYTITVTDGVTTIVQTIVFFTNTQSLCLQLLGGGFTDQEFAVALLIVCFTLFFVVGYRSKKRSGGAFMLLSGFFLISLAAVINILYAQVFIVPFAVFIIVIGIRKWLFRPAKEKTKTEGQ